MDDRQMKELTRVAREEDERETEQLERWDALNAGELSPEEEEELRASAAASEESAVLWQAFRPLEAEFQAQLVAKLRRQTSRAAPPPSPTAAPEPQAGPWSERVAAILQRFLRPRLMAPAAAVAFVLALLLWPVDELTPIAGYDFDLSGSVQPLRFEEAPAEGATSVFVDGNRFELLLTPETAVEGPLTARVFVAAHGAVAALDAPPPEVSEDGSVRLTGSVGEEIRLPPGDCDLLVVVGRPRRLPTPEELLASTRDRSSVRTPDWLAWKVALRAE